MSKYTTQVLQLVYGLTSETPFAPLSERLEKARQQIFNFEYPIWNEEHKKDLETKILRHYINYEIGLETYPLWQFYLETRLNEIMPYYVEMYESIYPFKSKLYYNQDVEETYTEKTTDDYTDKYDGTVQNYGDTDYTRKNDIDGTSNSLTTNDLTDDTTAEKNVTEKKNVKGDKLSDTTRTDNLTETVANSATSTNTRTDNLTETVDTDTTAKNTKTNDLTEDNTGSKDITNTRTDDLTEKTVLDKDVTETSKTTVTGRDLQVVSDLPQSNLGGLSVSTDIPDIYKLDYATQSTQNASTSTTDAKHDLQEDDTTTKTNTGTVKDVGKETTTGKTTNTGTVTDDGTGTEDTTKTNTGTVKNDGSEQSDTTKHNTGTQNHNGTEETSEDTTFTHKEDDTNVTTHTGTVNVDGTTSSKQNVVDHTKDVNLRTDKNQRVMDRDGSKTFTDTRLGLNGGKTYSEVIAEYLPEIKNIDMMIIKDLNSLFMQIF